ncbi:MAG: hypothetical protein Q7T54_00270 [Candidatus Levybacteria bacterium]|nr:hypothetical protein [Candidatus Levybacteria bacterium]
MKKLYLIQSSLLLSGTIFSWYTVANDYLKFVDGQGVNPITTPCFYGAIGFFVFYLYSLYIYFADQSQRRKHQKILVILLVGGTLFGWGNFAIELCNFYIFKNPTSCSGASTSSPFLTACFYGSVLYLLSLISSVVAFRKSKNPNK